MRRVPAILLAALLLFGLVLASALTPALAADAAAPATSGFNVEAFRKNFLAGLGGRANFPDLTAESVQVDQVERAASFGGMDIYAVKGRLVPAEGQSQPFLLFISADGQFHVSDIINLSQGKSILKDTRDKIRAEGLKGYGHTILKGAPGKPVVVYVSDPFCPYCRQAFNYLMAKKDSYSEFRLAHFPLPSHPGADIASALMVWAAEKAPQKVLDFVRFGYVDLAVPKIKDRSPESLKKAWIQVASAYLARFPELKALGKDGAAIVAALGGSEYAKRVAEDMATASSMDITGTPVIFVDKVRVVGFEEERLGELLK
ncbi:MAG: DsbA family protein [Proteobacteria bacterium]|nr:DsbA family protein [Pseudomonadota bacterium]